MEVKLAMSQKWVSMDLQTLFISKMNDDCTYTVYHVIYNNITEIECIGTTLI